MNFVYGFLATLGTAFMAIGFTGFWVSLSTYDITSAGVSAAVFMFSLLVTVLMAYRIKV